MAVWYTSLPTKVAALLLLLITRVLVDYAGAHSPHTSHWKGGAGIWHHNSEQLPDIGDRSSVVSVGSLTVHPSVLEPGDTVTVSWSGMNHSGVNDTIFVYCPETAEDLDYLDFGHVEFTEHDHGSMKFGPLVNMRCSYQFRYISTHNRTSVRLAVSEKVGFVSGFGQPTQGRLSLTGLPGQLRVMWVSAAEGGSVVEYYQGQGEMKTLSGTAHTYAAKDMCGAPANVTAAMRFRNPGFIHDVLLEDLDPETELRYRFGDSGSWSPFYTTHTPPKESFSPTRPVHLFVFGDLGEWRTPAGPPPGGRAYTTMWRIENDLFKNDTKYDMLLHVGDISYARGSAYQWEQFGANIQPVATAIPYHVGIGNHEYDHTSGGQQDPSGATGDGFHPSWGNYGDDSDGECAVPMVNRFHMPDNGNKMFWYSHNYAGIHMVWVSTEHDFTKGSEMYNWLKEDLSSVDRDVTPWVFLMGHRPMYCSRISSGNWIIQLHQRQEYEDLLYQYGVDVFFTGHYHSYDRTCPVYRNVCRTDGDESLATVHLMVGMAGAGIDPPEWQPELKWSSFHANEYGYSRIHVANQTHMEVEYVRNSDGKVIDHAWIVSNHRWHKDFH